jgi:hypothetical protein
MFISLSLSLLHLEIARVAGETCAFTAPVFLYTNIIIIIIIIIIHTAIMRRVH